MRKTSIALIVLAAGISVSVMALNVTHTETSATKSKIHSGMTTYGLHVSLPNNMKTLPVELLPLP